MASLSIKEISEIRASVRAQKQAEEKTLNDRIGELRKERSGLFTKYGDLEKARFAEVEADGELDMARRSEIKTELAAQKREEETEIDVETRKLVEEKSALYGKYHAMEKEMIAAAEQGEEPADEAMSDEPTVSEPIEPAAEPEEVAEEQEEVEEAREPEGLVEEELSNPEAAMEAENEVSEEALPPVVESAPAETAVAVPKPEPAVAAKPAAVPPVIEVEPEGPAVVALELVSVETGKSESLRATLDVSQAWLRGFAGEDSAYASSPQFRVVRDDSNAWHLEKTSPKNPTFLNGAEPDADRVPLSPGDVISIGSRKGNPDKMKLEVKFGD